MKRLTLILSILCSLAFVGCNSDYYLANSYLNKFERGSDKATETIYVRMPQGLIHTNSSLNDVPGFMFMSVEEQDSVIASKTAILDKLDDSIFMNQFASLFLFTLSRTQMPIVLVPADAAMPAADNQHLVVDFVQMEADEYIEPHRSDFSTRKGLRYSYDYELRHFALNLWLQFGAGDSSVYFKGDEVAEQFSGTVTALRDGRADLKTHFDRINVNDAYTLARRMGYQCAVLFVEKMLTDHVRDVKGANEFYFLYDPRFNAIDEVVPISEASSWGFEKL